MRAKTVVLKMLLGMALAASSSRAADLGMPAPELQVQQWILSGPVMQDGKITVLEFRDETTPIGTLEVLGALQAKYRPSNVVCASISSQSPAELQTWIRKHGAKLDCALAADSQGKTASAFLAPFGLTELPHAFIIHTNHTIIWHGHPEGGLAEVLDEIVTGKFVLAFAQRAERARQLQERYFALVSTTGPTAETRALGRQIMVELEKFPGGLSYFAWRILMERKIKKRDVALAYEAAKLAFETSPTREAALLDTYARALFLTGRSAEAIQRQKEAIAASKDDAQRFDFESRLNRYVRLAGQQTNQSIPARRSAR